MKVDAYHLLTIQNNLKKSRGLKRMRCKCILYINIKAVAIGIGRTDVDSLSYAILQLLEKVVDYQLHNEIMKNIEKNINQDLLYDAHSTLLTDSNIDAENVNNIYKLRLKVTSYINFILNNSLGNKKNIPSY